MALVEGARALFWWSLGGNALADVCGDRAVWCPERVQHLDDLAAVMTSLAELEPAILAPDTPAALTEVGGGDVRTRVKTVGGVIYLLAYNATAAPVDATFTLAAAPSRVAVQAEARELEPTEARFSDRFEAHDAHVYAIAGAGVGAAPR
jgi:hypothetical protein